MNMKLVVYIALFCFIENAVDAGPTECYSCTDVDAATCSANQKSQTCATDPNSLGITHCGTMVGIFKNHSKSGNEFEGIFRGCINCADKEAACFALGGAFKASKVWILQACKLECCTGNNCNTQTPPLSQDAINVYNPFAGVPGLTVSCLPRE
ncbi:hypothetical protein OS493_034435 [Desmophyllum pertusum]|uniref:Sodefrin-like factor n=1 Tax=Desmophyllum pertusum TaxID=174260 RepID=A0A9X0D2L2_9CNID|nr:hypothetical protein OS493_034435 [Desmophyllum pertusum]